jgi:hypothetical protein
MRSVVVFALLCVFGAGLAGCEDPNIRPIHISFGSTNDTLAMGPALRVVTDRQRPLEDGKWLPTVCSEPSPDVAVAFGRSLAAQGSYSEPNAASVSGSVNAASTEVATALVGRTAGVLALRDGLYAACQSYVNGVLGHDAYAVILSQYGNLLVALAGTGTSGNPTAYTAQETAIAAMLVACVSANDPTRIRPVLANGEPDINPLLTPARCKVLLDNIASGKLLAPPAKKTADATSKATKAKAPGAGEKVVTTTQTVTEKTGAPLSPVAATGAAAKP